MQQPLDFFSLFTKLMLFLLGLSLPRELHGATNASPCREGGGGRGGVLEEPTA